MSFLAKLRTVALGNVHDLLDKAIDMNSSSAVRQHVRDLEDARDSMRNSAAEQAGYVRTLEREVADLQTKIDADKVFITRVLAGAAPNKEEAARGKAAEVVALTKQLDTKKGDIASQKLTSANLDQALAKVELQHTMFVNRVHELEHLDKDTKNKEKAAHAVEAAGKVMGNGADLSVDDIETKMRARNDVASVKFERAMGTLPADSPIDPDVDDLLASLRPKETVGAV